MAVLERRVGRLPAAKAPAVKAVSPPLTGAIALLLAYGRSLLLAAGSAGEGALLREI
jgi:hypothetical protein